MSIHSSGVDNHGQRRSSRESVEAMEDLPSFANDRPVRLGNDCSYHGEDWRKHRHLREKRQERNLDIRRQTLALASMSTTDLVAMLQANEALDAEIMHQETAPIMAASTG